MIKEIINKAPLSRLHDRLWKLTFSWSFSTVRMPEGVENTGIDWIRKVSQQVSQVKEKCIKSCTGWTGWTICNSPYLLKHLMWTGGVRCGCSGYCNNAAGPILPVLLDINIYSSASTARSHSDNTARRACRPSLAVADPDGQYLCKKAIRQLDGDALKHCAEAEMSIQMNFSIRNRTVRMHHVSFITATEIVSYLHIFSLGA